MNELDDLPDVGAGLSVRADEAGVGDGRGDGAEFGLVPVLNEELEGAPGFSRAAGAGAGAEGVGVAARCAGTSTMAFELASTNLVIELGIILVVLLGWPFAAAEFAGGILMVVFIALIFRITLTPKLVEAARAQAERGLAGRMEGHAAMDMSVTEGSLWSRLTSARGFTAISHYFVMDWMSIWVDLLLGFLIAGALAAWVPDGFWRNFFLTDHPTLAKIEGPLVGPLVAVVSFVCSVGNVPLAAVLWQGGISFGGVVSFIFADLIVLPIIDIYRRYYTLKVALYITATFYVAMAAAGYVVELAFGALGIVPTNRNVSAIDAHPALNYTAGLNAVFLIIALVLVVRFLRTGGPAMLRMMNQPAMGHEPGSAGAPMRHDHH